MALIASAAAARTCGSSSFKALWRQKGTLGYPCGSISRRALTADSRHQGGRVGQRVAKIRDRRLGFRPDPTEKPRSPLPNACSRILQGAAQLGNAGGRIGSKRFQNLRCYATGLLGSLLGGGQGIGLRPLIIGYLGNQMDQFGNCRRRPRTDLAECHDCLVANVGSFNPQGGPQLGHGLFSRRPQLDQRRRPPLGGRRGRRGRALGKTANVFGAPAAIFARSSMSLWILANDSVAARRTSEFSSLSSFVSWGTAWAAADPYWPTHQTAAKRPSASRSSRRCVVTGT